MPDSILCTWFTWRCSWTLSGNLFLHLWHSEGLADTYSASSITSSLGWWFLMWSSKLRFCAVPFLQYLQGKEKFFSWIFLLCDVKSCFCVNSFSQISQGNFTLSCTEATCVSRLHFLANLLSHCEQAKFLTLKWTLSICLLRSDFLANFFPHRSHLKKFFLSDSETLKQITLFVLTLHVWDLSASSEANEVWQLSQGYTSVDQSSFPLNRCTAWNIDITIY